MTPALGLTLLFLSYQPLTANPPEAYPTEGGPPEAAGDDECFTGGGEAGSECTLTALQRRVLRFTSTGSSAEEASEEALREVRPAAAQAETGAEELIEEATRAHSQHNNAALAALGVRFDASNMAHDLMRMGAPKTALAYDGMAWPHMVVSGGGPHHIFAIGDWGGMDGAFQPGGGRKRIKAYRGGREPGPHVFPRTRWNAGHSAVICNHSEFRRCYQPSREGCPEACGFVPGVDDQAQLLVAKVFNDRASRPKLVLNVGDNFYYGGLEVDCGTPMDASSLAQTHQFNSIFEDVYEGAAPWISALGNHDWGGWQFTNGWDQQIAYTWKSGRWVMPASYYSQRVIFEGAGFTLDIFVLDSNHQDAKPPPEDPSHNICSEAHNRPGASCPGGPPSVDACDEWFQGRWRAQQSWLSQRLAESGADWKVGLTHFPCGSDGDFWMRMHRQFGLDLLVTGHRHDQELWPPDRLGGLTCFVTGGGGGISSEASPSEEHRDKWYGEGQYGFYDLTVTRSEILIESVSWSGEVVKSAQVLRGGGSATAGGAAGGHAGDGRGQRAA